MASSCFDRNHDRESKDDRWVSHKYADNDRDKSGLKRRMESPNSTTLTFNENPSLLDADIVTVVVGCSIESISIEPLGFVWIVDQPEYIFLDEA